MNALFWNRGGILLLLALVGIGLAAWALWQRPHTYTVVRTADGFEPATISIRVGDTIEFVSKAGEPFWPASDFHPTHQLYPEFDPKRSLTPDEHWSFTFERGGVWTYHDHLSSTVHSTINVVGGSPEDVASCTEQTQTEKYCWAPLFTSIVRDQGLAAAFDEFAKLYSSDPNFRQSCHDTMHILGKAAYDQFEKDYRVVVRPETSYCAYGFYHGYIEELSNEEGKLDIANLAEVCEYVRTNKSFPSRSAADAAARSCYHGIGHALFDSLDSRLWGDGLNMIEQTIKECNQLPNFGRQKCADGAFNALVVAQATGLYNLGQPTSLASICQAVPSYKDQCYIYATPRTNRLSDTASFVSQIPVAYRADAITAAVRDYVRVYEPSATAADMYALCPIFKSEGLNGCVRGILQALVSSAVVSTTQMEEKETALCSLIQQQSPTRAFCFKSMGISLSLIYSDARAKAVCAVLRPEDASACKSSYQK